jgi:hypothetical protein
MAVLTFTVFTPHPAAIGPYPLSSHRIRHASGSESVV